MVSKSIFYLFLAILVFCVSGCDTKSSKQPEKPIFTTQNIKERDVLVVGVKTDTHKFGFKDPNTGVIDGFDVDIAKALARKILGSSRKLKLVTVTPSSRGAALENNEVDYVIATFTITEDRRKIYNISEPYYTDDGVGIMVKKSSKIKFFGDLSDKKVGVVTGTTALRDVQEVANKEKIKIQIVEFDTYPQVKAALDNGQIDCFSTNKIVLAQFAENDDTILSDKFIPQSYGIVAKKGNDELIVVANEFISELNLRGEMQHMVAKWGL